MLGPSDRVNRGETTINCISSQCSFGEEILTLESDFNDRSEEYEKGLSQEDKSVIKLAEKSVNVNDQRYVLPLPCKTDWKLTPYNRWIAERRLGCLRHWLLKDENMRSDQPATGKGILPGTASLCNPLIYIATLCLRPKKLSQVLCRFKTGLDDPIKSSVAFIWERWKHRIRVVRELRIILCSTKGLHMFSDASEVGYGAVAYLRSETADGIVLCSFLMGKSRVSPLKIITIPRLELQAAVVSVRLMRHISREVRFKLDEICFWTDSSIVLHYIRNTSSRFKTFVANRLCYIHKYSNASQWKHVPSEQNPADLASRGIVSGKVDELKRWLNGPEFLGLDIASWPKLSIIPLDSHPMLEERKKATVLCFTNEDNPTDHLLSYFSSWAKTKKTVAWFIRFRRFLGSSRVRGPLTAADVEEAEFAIIRYIQARSFHEAQKESYLKKLCPFIKDGLLCVGGRLNNSNVDFRMKHPIILPGNHPVTVAIIRHYHVTEGHMGASYVLNVIRQKYWILKGLSAVKRVIHRCIGCRMRSGVPVNQLMSALPSARVTPDYPFAATGIDYFGPFHVKEGRKRLKRYGCVFTCLRTRAVHIEVAHELSTDSFLMAFSRFINRRGCPKEIYSDQGTNFVGAERVLKNWKVCVDDQKCSRMSVEHGITWHFNPPYSSHRGGIWERIIRSIRRILSAVSGEQTLTQESLLTFLSEVERILNNRPITQVCDDPTALEPLTPNHLLLPYQSGYSSETQVDIRDRYNRHWKQAQLLATTFWRRWVKEYLPTLQLRSKWLIRSRNHDVGDMVLVNDQSLPKGSWLKGVVVEVIKGEDGCVREVHVKTSSGFLHRDVRKVCLLEGAEEPKSAVC